MRMKRDHQMFLNSFSGIKKNGIIWPREGIDGFAFFRNQPMPNITVSSLKKENDKLKG